MENLPCSETYNDMRPEVRKVWKDGDTVSDIVQYIDDSWILASTEERSWLAQSKMTKTLSYLGLQDAARKRYIGSRRPGAWAGVVVPTNKEVVMKNVSRDRWSKTQQKVRSIDEYLDMLDEYASIDDEGATEERANSPRV